MVSVALLRAYLVAQSVESACTAGDLGLILEDPLEKEMAPTPGLLPGESHGLRSLVGSGHGVARAGHDLVTKPPPAQLCWILAST